MSVLDGKTIQLTSSDFWLMPADGKSAKQLTQIGFVNNPVWVDDGTQIAFISTESGQPDIYVMPTGGGFARRVTNSPGQESTPSWSADGKRLIYSMATTRSTITTVRVTLSHAREN